MKRLVKSLVFSLLILPLASCSKEVRRLALDNDLIHNNHQSVIDQSLIDNNDASDQQLILSTAAVGNAIDCNENSLQERDEADEAKQDANFIKQRVEDLQVLQNILFRCTKNV